MWNQIQRFMAESWLGLLVAALLTYIAVYLAIWGVIEPIGISDSFNNIPAWGQQRWFYHLLGTLSVAPIVLLVLQRIRERKHGEAIRHLLRSRSSRETNRPKLTFSNVSSRAIDIYWINHAGAEELQGKVMPNQESHFSNSYATHPFLIKDSSTGERLFIAVPLNESPFEGEVIVEK